MANKLHLASNTIYIQLLLVKKGPYLKTKSKVGPFLTQIDLIYIKGTLLLK